MTTGRRKSEAGEGFGERVRRLRIERGWTQEQLARQADLSKSAISEAESAATQPRGQNLVRIASALGASIDFLLTGQERSQLPAPPVINVPSELAEMARKLALPFQHVELLMQFSGQIEAMRRDEVRRLTERDWEDLWERVRPLLDKSSGGKTK